MRVWREIDGFPDYSVSDRGEIKLWGRVDPRNGKYIKDRILKLRETPRGLGVTLWHKGASEVVVVRELLHRYFPKNRVFGKHYGSIYQDDA